MDKQYQEIIKKFLPSKTDFQTFSGSPAFTPQELIAPYNLNNSYQASLVGIAFDYLARFMTAHNLNEIDESIFKLNALKGLQRLKGKVDEKTFKNLDSKYVTSLNNIMSYVLMYSLNINKIQTKNLERQEFNAFCTYLESTNKKKINLECLLSDACYLAKLEQIYRSGFNSFNFEELFEPPATKIIEDLMKLCKIFQERFIDNGIVQPNSTVVFNPQFGIGSFACRGADADIYIDGTLYDFKTSKNNGYNWKEVAQLVSYYYLNVFAYNCNSYLNNSAYKSIKAKTFKKFISQFNLPPAQLIQYNIHNIAFYRARYGEIEYCNTSVFNNKYNKFDELFQYYMDKFDETCSYYTG